MNKKKLRYTILKELNERNNFNENDLEVTADEFDNALRFLDREEYIQGVFYADDRPWIFDGAILTEKGENHLEENAPWKKAYNTLKEARDWLKI